MKTLFILVLLISNISLAKHSELDCLIKASKQAHVKLNKMTHMLMVCANANINDNDLFEEDGKTINRTKTINKLFLRNDCMFMTFTLNKFLKHCKKN